MRFIALALVVCACAAPTKRSSPASDDDARRAIDELRASRFPEAERAAAAALAKSPSSTAAAVHAIAHYEAAVTTLVRELGGVLDRGEDLHYFDHEKGRAVWMTFLAELDAVDHDLGIASTDPSFSLEVCLACWEHDWNGNGRVDDRDRKLFELEYDGKGGELAEDDSRRRPTYRFDVGDIYWARAMVAFQRATVQLILAYRWSALDKLFQHDAQKIEIVLVDPGRVAATRELLFAGLAYADEERRAYLAETDDDREWVPNPRQKSYAMPLPVDDDLYTTWASLLGDVDRLVASKDGVSIRELGVLLGERNMPDAYVDLGKLLREPQNIVVDLAALDGPAENYEAFLRALLGHGYARKMRASPLVAHLAHMKETLDRGEDTLEKKLRYLIWFN